MRPSKVARAAGTGASVPIESCQVCGHAPLDAVLSLGFMPPVNQMVPIGQVPRQLPWFPTTLLHCRNCDLVQLGLAVDPTIIFPPEYPYTSGTTKLLRDNFADLQRESAAMLGLGEKDLVVDIGSNDGTLLSNFKNGGQRVLGIEPTDVGDIANQRGIQTIKRYFGVDVAREVKRDFGAASVVTAANCFAHIEDVHAIVDGIVEMLKPDGVFISESHYLIPLLDTLQYDTIYHEHLRYYSLGSLKHLLEMHGLEVIHARPIPSHGGSIRVYAARQGTHAVQNSVRHMLAEEPRGEAMVKRLDKFRNDVILSKLRLLSMVRDLKEKGARIAGISAPSRASTLVNYVGLDEGLIDFVCEIRRLAQDREVHAGHTDSGCRRIAVVFRPARLCDHLLLAHRRRAGAETQGKGLPRDADHASAGTAHAVGRPMNIDGAQDKGKEIAFFDAHAESDEYDVFTPQANEALIAAFVRLSGLPAEARVADLGCGSGAFTELLRRRGYQSIGLDISPKLVALGRRKYPGLELIEGDAENLPFESASLDGVLLSGLVHHFPDPRRLAGEVKRVLRNGGRFVAFDPNRMNPFMWLYRDRASPFYSSVGVTENERPVLAWKIADIFRDEGFRVQTDYLAGLAYRYVASRRTRMLLPIYNFIDGAVFNLAIMQPFRPFVLTSGEKL